MNFYSESYGAQLLSCVQLFETLRTIVQQASPSMGFSRQEYCRGLPFPPPGDLPNTEIQPLYPVSLALADGFFTTEPPGKPPETYEHHITWPHFKRYLIYFISSGSLISKS